MNLAPALLALVAVAVSVAVLTVAAGRAEAARRILAQRRPVPVPAASRRLGRQADRLGGAVGRRLPR